MGFYNPPTTLPASSIVVGTTTITGGTASGILWNNAGVLAGGPAVTDATGNVNAATAAAVGFVSSSKMNAPSDGILTLLNNAGSGFTRLQLGGTTASFPAFQANGSNIDLITASNSNFASIRLLAVTINDTSFLLRTGTAMPNGAAAQTATLTNGPTAGNPTKWIPINDNGTTRYIPTW